MDNQQKKRILSQYLEIKAETKQIQEYYTEMRLSLESAQAQVLTDMPRGGGGRTDKIGDGLARLEDYYNKHVDLVDAYLAIEKCISRLKDLTLRKLMRLRYIQGLTWEEIYKEIEYECTHTHRLHNKALDLLKMDDLEWLTQPIN